MLGNGTLQTNVISPNITRNTLHTHLTPTVLLPPGPRLEQVSVS